MATVLDRPNPPDPFIRPALITVDDVEAIMAARELDRWRVELIDGELSEVPPQQKPHLIVKAELGRLLTLALQHLPTHYVTQDGCFFVSQLTLPEPDIMVWQDLDSEKWVPTKAVRLVAEVCSTSHRRDYGRKVALYGQAGVPEYWIADLDTRSIVRMWRPEKGLYTMRTEHAFGEIVASPTLEVELDTSRLASLD